MKKPWLFFLLILSPWVLSAQVVTSEPPFPTIDDPVVITFHADRGDGGLKGFTGDVYAHTGVITDQSVNSHDWKHVIGTWGDNTVQPQLTNVGQDLWELNIGDIRTFYGIPASEKVLQLAFVFRSANTQKTGRDVGGADIFFDLFESGLTVVLLEPQVQVPFGDPARSPVFTNLADTLAIAATGAALGPPLASLTLFVDGAQKAQVTEDTLTFDFVAADFGYGKKRLEIIGEDMAGERDSISFVVMVNRPPLDIPTPDGVVDGVNIVGNSSVTFSLFAPFKAFVYVVGDFNDWKVDTAYYMNRYEIRPDSVRFWLTVDGLDPNTEYAFQFLVDGQIRIADPYTAKVLVPGDDQFIGPNTFPNLKPFPDGKTSDDVSTFKINEAEYQWQVTDFQRPEPKDLVIYELLVRDFIAAHNYSTLIDTLDYLQRLGIKAIELMPVTEFEGNLSWGYNPAFYFAPDKYYGPENDLKRFIDACHKRGLAVILDAVLNHSFGQSPFVRLYSSGNFGPPTAENPWYNVTATHPFSVGFDFNHESPDTKALVDRVNAYWLQEFRVDGFRFDLSKGFTQKFSGNNVGLWSAFDASRIAILERMADKIWSVDSSAYVILEHFAENSEEIELSNHGMLLWGNMNVPYSQSAMGFLQDPQRSSDLSGGYYKNRGWSQPNLISYMESHDEPWLMYKNLQFGRSNADGTYRVKDLATALNRIKLVASFFLTIPGPKMLWQFGELGYDQFLPESGSERTAPKPILWNYYNNPDRRRLYKFMAALLKLRNDHEVFRSPDTVVKMRVGQGQFDRRINLSHPSLNVTIIGDFDVNPRNVTPNFQHTGTWYDFFLADSLEVTNPNASIALQAGEFHIFTDKKLESPAEDLITSVATDPTPGPSSFELQQNYPNPFNPQTTIKYAITRKTRVTLSIYNILGQKIATLVDEAQGAGQHSVTWDGRDGTGRLVPSGIYVYRLQAGRFVKTRKMLLVK